MDRRTDQSETAKKDADLIHIDPALEIHNYESSFNTYYHILTPLHVIVMYNTCNIPNVADALFSVSRRAPITRPTRCTRSTSPSLTATTILNF